MPTIDEVEDFEFSMRVEAEKRGEEAQDNDDDNTDDDADDDNGDAPQPDVTVQDRTGRSHFKICFDGEACIASLPCGHMVMCPPCSDRIMLDNKRCPLSHANSMSTLRVWFG